MPKTWRTRKRGTARQIGQKFPLLQKKKLPARMSLKSGNKYVMKQALKVKSALVDYAKKHGFPTKMRIVGGVRMRGYSKKDIDIAVDPDFSWEFSNALKEIKLPRGITPKDIDIIPDYGGTEIEWLRSALDAMPPEDDPKTYEKIRKKLQEYEEIIKKRGGKFRVFVIETRSGQRFIEHAENSRTALENISKRKNVPINHLRVMN